MKIHELVELLFEKIALSKEILEIKQKIEQSLTKEYVDQCQSDNKIEALGYIMKEYGTIEKAGLLAGYSLSQIKSWQDEGDIVDYKKFRNKIKKLKIFTYLSIIFTIFLVISVIDVFIFQNLFYFFSMAINGGLGFLTYKKYLLIKKDLYQSKLTVDNYDYLKEQLDNYRKKTINMIALLFGYFIYLLILILTALRSMNGAEIIQLIYSQITFIEIMIFLVTKNIIMEKVFNYYISYNNQDYHWHLKRFSLFSGIYWLIVIVCLIVMDLKIINLSFYLICLYGLIVVIYNYTWRKQIVYQNIKINKKRITIVTLAICIVLGYGFMKMDTWLIQPYISSVSAIEHNSNQIEYDDFTGTYTITKKQDDFKILQLTDIHLGGSLLSFSKDHKALKAVYDLIEHTKPDLVVITGDLVFPLGVMSYSFNNYTPIMQFASFMRNISIPWVFVYGNHDTESLATSSKEEIDQLFQKLSYKSSQTLLYPYIQPSITGRNNQVIEIKNQNGSLNQALFLMDSNDYTGMKVNDYDYIHDDQVNWYEDNIKRLSLEYKQKISSMLFFHIPLQEYKEANDLYESGSDQVKYYFGEIGETMIDKICCSKYPSKLFDRAVALQSTKAMFCGHDHYNNISLEYQGIRLTYGMSIDYLAMPGIEKDVEQRGGTLITLYQDSSFDIEQIKLMDIVNK